MSCHIRSLVACVTVIVLAAGLAGPERLLGAIWDWIAGEIAPGAFQSLWGTEGWGMDPNGGGPTNLPPGGHP
jgi:hypothetical protein